MLRIAILVSALPCIVSCGREERGRPLGSHDGVTATSSGSRGDQKQEAASQDPAVTRGDRQRTHGRIPSQNASFRFYQRLAKNSDWDKGKTIPSATGLAMVKLLQGAELWSSETHPQYVTAWGTHPYLPGYGAALDVIDSGKVTHYMFRTGGGLFDVNGDLWVIPPENKEALGALFKTVSDKSREKFWR